VASESILSPRTVDGHLALDFAPALGADPELRSALLQACTGSEIYLVAIDSFDDLVLRHDLRRAAIKEFASNAQLSAWDLRWTALRARLARYVSRDGLTERGSIQARGACERLQRLVEQLQTTPLQ
jgi:hypothetical protein